MLYAYPLITRGFLTELKAYIRAAQVRAALAVNTELVQRYWRIGYQILQRQQQQGWGTKVVDQLAQDLRQEFPEASGFSPRNLKYMRAFAQAWPELAIVQQVAAQIPWFHNCVLLDKVKDPAERAWYVHQTIENGWSRNVLTAQVESGLYHRQGRAVSNFGRPNSILALLHLHGAGAQRRLAAGGQALGREPEGA